MPTSMTILVAILLLAACGRPPQYPQQLVEADSAMRGGRYDQADSLLKAYRLTTEPSKNNEVRRYLQLLTLESKFLRGNSSLDDLLLADSLRIFYESSSKEKHAKALAILGDIYFVSYDYPSALEFLLKAEEEAELAKELWLQGIICKQKGDIYLEQQMFNDMVKSYEEGFRKAKASKDTLRMANGAHRMGKAYTYLQKVDSTIYFYNLAKSLAKSLSNNHQRLDITSHSNFALADIYLQIEELDSAVAIMPHDTLNDINWAYWHYQKDNRDSALYYFKKSLHRDQYGYDSYYLQLMAELEEKDGNWRNAIEYLNKSLAANDSIQKKSQAETFQRINAQYCLNKIEKELLSANRQKSFLALLSTSITIILLMCFFIGYLLIKYHKNKEKERNTYEKILRLQMEQKRQMSCEQIEDNRHKIEILEKELKEAKKTADHSVIQKLKLSSESLVAENEKIVTIKENQERLEKLWKQSDLYKKVQQQAGTSGFNLHDEEWQEIENAIDTVYDNFTSRLTELTKLSEIERQICYLLKMEIKPAAIAETLRRQKGSITMARKRLGKKILRRDCTAEDFDSFIQNF